MICTICGKKEAVFRCSCSLYLCVKDLGVHMEANEDHPYVNLKKTLVDSELNYKQDLSDKIQKIANLKALIDSNTRALIKCIEAFNNAMVRKLEELETEFVSLISLQELTEKGVSGIRKALETNLILEPVKIELCECIKQMYSQEIIIVPVKTTDGKKLDLERGETKRKKPEEEKKRELEIRREKKRIREAEKKLEEEMKKEAERKRMVEE